MPQTSLFWLSASSDSEFEVCVSILSTSKILTRAIVHTCVLCWSCPLASISGCARLFFLWLTQNIWSSDLFVQIFHRVTTEDGHSHDSGCIWMIYFWNLFVNTKITFPGKGLFKLAGCVCNQVPDLCGNCLMHSLSVSPFFWKPSLYSSHCTQRVKQATVQTGQLCYLFIWTKIWSPMLSYKIILVQNIVSPWKTQDLSSLLPKITTKYLVSPSAVCWHLLILVVQLFIHDLLWMVFDSDRAENNMPE